MAKRAPRVEVAGLFGVAQARERRGPAGFGEPVCPGLHPGEARERLDGDAAEREAVADLAEYLSGAAVVVRGGAVGEAGEQNRARRVDAVMRIGRARAQVERPKTVAAVDRGVTAFNRGGAPPRAHIHPRVREAGGEAELPAVAEPFVDADDSAAEPAVDGGRTAVAAECAPGAKALRPEGQGRGRRRREWRGLRRQVRRIGQHRATHGKRCHRPAVERRLPQPAKHRVADIAAVLGQHARRAGMHLAGKRIKCGARLIGGGERHRRAIDRIERTERLHRRGGRDLVRVFATLASATVCSSVRNTLLAS